MLTDWNREGEDRPWKAGHKAETPRVWKGLLLTQLEKGRPFSLLVPLAPHQGKPLGEQSLDRVSGPTSQPVALAWGTPCVLPHGWTCVGIPALLVPIENANWVDSSLPGFWANAQFVHRKG